MQAKAKRGLIPPDWVLLDTCSTNNVIHDLSLLTNIKDCTSRQEVKIHANGRSLCNKTMGLLKYIPVKCYYNSNSIENVLLLKSVADIQGFNITMNTDEGSDIYVKSGTSKLLFRQTSSGLYYCMVDELKKCNESIKNIPSSFTFLSLRESRYKQSDINKANNARNLQRAMMWPSTKVIKKLITHNYITDTGVKPEDFDIADDLLGKSADEVGGKMKAPTKTRDQSSQVLLYDIKTHINRRIKLYIDIMYVCGRFFLHTKSKEIDYITIHFIQNHKFSNISKKLKLVIKRYLTRGFTVTDVFGDNEFGSEQYINLFLPATLHICSKGEHVLIIERSIRTVKERARSAIVGLPFETVPQIMAVELLEGVERWLNAFPSGDIDGTRTSPAMIIEGRQNPRDDFPRVAYWSYTLVYIGTSNTLENRTVLAIALRESNNNGGHYFISLKTGKRIHSNKWVEMVTTDRQINRVHELAETEGNHYWTSEIINSEHEFIAPISLDTSSYEIVNEVDPSADENETEAINSRIERTNQYLENDDSTDEIIDTETSSETYSDSKDSTYVNESDEDAISVPMLVNSEDFSFNIQNAYDAHTMDNNDIGNKDKDIIHNDELEMYTIESSTISDIDIPITAMSKEKGTEASSDSISDNEGSDKGNIQCFQVSDTYDKALHVMFTQMSVHKGIKLFGERVIAAMMKELKQLNDGVIPGNPVIEPIPFDKLTSKDKNEALEAVNIIAEKRIGKIKGRMCANGYRQRKNLKEGENFASPTASLKSILATLVIDAQEGRDIAIADVPGAYLNTKFPNDKKVILRMTDIFVDVMCKINEDYRDHVIYEVNKKGKRVKCL